MTTIRKFVAMSAAVLGVSLCQSVNAQIDEDALLDDDSEEVASEESDADETPAATEEAEGEAVASEGEDAAETPAEEASEEPAAEPTAEAEETPAAEEETPAAEEETPAAEEDAAAPVDAETPVAEDEPAAPAETPAAPAEEPAAPAEAPAAPAETPAVPVEAETEEIPLSLLDQLVAQPEAPAAGETAAAADPAPAAAVPADPEKELINDLVKTEHMRREALDEVAMTELAEGRLCRDKGEYMDAIQHYYNARKIFSDRRNRKAQRKECDTGIADCLFLAALEERKIGRNDKARELMEKAREMRHKQANAMLIKWAEEAAKAEANPIDEASEYTHQMHDEDYKAERDQIRKHLRRATQFLAIRDMSKALEECEIVLKNDPYNQKAIRIRNVIEKKRRTILAQERAATREGMIADVDEAWRPVYAVNAKQLTANTAETVKTQTGDDPERTMEQDIERRMKEMILPSVSFKPPATIIEAVDFFRQASKDYDRPEIPVEKRGFNFVLRTPVGAIKTSAPVEDNSDEFSTGEEETDAAPTNGLEPIQTITASDISFHEALKLVCDSVQYKFIVRGQIVMVMPIDMSTAELIARKYNVPEAFVERVSNASDEIKQMGGFGANSSGRKKASDEEEGEGQDWKAFFEEMGVKWPEGSSIKHIKALGKLYVRNTRENLAEFEKVLDELGGQPQLIEIETRFVEVSQEDLNSLGFEWILNSNYTIGLGDSLGRALGVRGADYGPVQRTTTSPTTTTTTMEQINVGGTLVNVQNTTTTGSSTVSDAGTRFQRTSGAGRNIGIDAFGGTSDYQNGNRFLSTTGNHISGEGKSNNDQFMKVNAFLGNADLSMILHMLAQRSDTDLLSAPKIVTKSGENAVIKVVTEFIYPQDYDVQLQSSSSSGGNNGGSQSAVLAIVEPQNFTKRDVGVILDVTPTYSEANGGTIDLELKPQVVDEPTWKNYGMKIPFTGNSSLQNFEGIGGIFDGLANSINAIGEIPSHVKNWIITTETQAAQDALDGLTRSGSDNITYYDAPMEQPFFHVREIDSKVSITPGATVVMGGLITEQRKAMDDKVPFLGDLPFIGRLFRSHAERTLKRNLLIFVTGRLITPSGRELRVDGSEIGNSDAEVKAAPSND